MAINFDHPANIIDSDGAAIILNKPINIAAGISLTGAASNLINFNTAGVAAPSFTTRSAGTKIVLNSALSGTTVDFAIGIEGSTLWQSVPDSNRMFRWYAGTTNIATLSGGGRFTAGNAVFSTQDQLRLKTSTGATGYGVIHRHDGANYYLLLTALDDADGGWTSARPFAINLSSAAVSSSTPWSMSANVASTSTGTGTLRVTGGVGVTGAIYAGSKISTTNQLESTVATGTAPLVVSSTTVVPNLNADMLDGLHASEFLLSGSTPNAAPAASSGTGALLAYVYECSFPGSGALQTSRTGRFLGTRLETTLDYSIVPAVEGSASNRLWRIMGWIRSPTTETYTFYTTRDDGLRLFVDGQYICGTWTNGGGIVESGTIALTANVYVPIFVEWYNGTGGAVLRLEWESTTTTRAVVPSTAFAWSQQGSDMLNTRTMLAHDNARVLGTVTSTSPTTGALTVAGGAGIAGELHVGSTITAADPTAGAHVVTRSAGDARYLALSGGTMTGNFYVNNVNSSSGTARNRGVYLWTDKSFGLDLHYDANGWAPLLYGRTNSADGEIRFGTYTTTATAQNSVTMYGKFGKTGGLVLGDPTGGDLGAGVLNATGISVNNNPVFHAGNIAPTSWTHLGGDYGATNTTYRLLATLPVSTGGTFDSLEVEVAGGGWNSNQRGRYRILLSNRDAFVWHFESFENTGIAKPRLRVVAYRQVDGSTQVYVALSSYVSGGISARAFGVSGQSVTVTPGAASTTEPAGTVVFDTAVDTPSVRFDGTSLYAKGDKLAALAAANNFTADQWISNTSPSTSPSTGALKVSGGIGAGGSLHLAGGTLSLSNASSNTILFNTVGVAAPSFTTRSLGTKIVLYSNLGGSSADYALGIASNTLWSSVPSNTQSFKWFAGTTEIASLSGAGVLSLPVATGTAPLAITSTTRVTNLNADQVDDLHASSFMRSDADTNFSAGAETRYFYISRSVANVIPTNEYGRFGMNDGRFLVETMNDESAGGVRFNLAATDTADGGIGTNASNGYIDFVTSAAGRVISVDGNVVWHAGNDGAGSNLDADLLDGQQGSYYTNANNLLSGTVPTARLGTGTASTATFLRGDSTWATALTAEVDTLATVTGRGATTATALSLTNATASTSTATGALTVSGGVGVTGDLHVGGAIVNTNTVSGPNIILAGPGTAATDVFGIEFRESNAPNDRFGLVAKMNGAGASNKLFITATASGANPAVADAKVAIGHTGIIEAMGNIASTSTITGTVVVTGGLGLSGALNAGGKISTTNQLESTLATGTAPLVVTSTTAVTNLNADLLDGQHGSYYNSLTNATGNLAVARLDGGTGASASSFWRGDGSWSSPMAGVIYTISNTSFYAKTADRNSGFQFAGADLGTGAPPSSLVTTAATAVGSAVLTFANTSGLVVGMRVIGTGIPDLAMISSLDATTVTMTENATGSGVALGASVHFVTATEMMRVVARNGNYGMIRTYQYRSEAGGDWTQASLRQQMRIDGTDMAFIEFNTPGYNYGLALGSGPVHNSSYGLWMSSSGTITIRTTMVMGTGDNTIAPTSGSIRSPSALVGSTNTNGGDFYLSAGSSTGSGSSVIYFQTAGDGTSGTTTNSRRPVVSINGSGHITLGARDYTSTPDNSVIQATRAAGTNVAGSNLTINAGRSTGSGLGGSLIFQTASAGGSGSTLNSVVPRLVIDQTGVADFKLAPTLNGQLLVSQASMTGGRPYESGIDLNTLNTLYEAKFLNVTGGTNFPTGFSGTGYYFGMGAGDVSNRGFQLLGTSASTGQLFFRDKLNLVWKRVWDDSNFIPANYATTANPSFTGTVTASGGTINLTNGASNLINFGNTGVAAPSFTTRSIGTKITLYDNLSATSATYAIGIESNTLWTSVPTTSGVFKWYGGITEAASLNGTGTFTAAKGVFTTSNQLLLKTSTGTTGYGVIHRVDPSSYFIMLTNNDDANGAWNALRPLVINLATGAVSTNTPFTTSSTFTSTMVTASGAPFTVASTALVSNLNADMVDGLHAASTNTANTVVSRDGAGAFAAGTITTTWVDSSGVVLARKGNVGQVEVGSNDNGSIEIGQPGRATAGSPFIDFHSSQNSPDYDVRLMVTGGSSSGNSGGTFTVSAANTTVTGNLTTSADLTVAGRLLNLSNKYPEYHYRHSVGSDFTWKKIADVTQANSTYSACIIAVDLLFTLTNWGETERTRAMRFVARPARASGVLNNIDSGQVTGPVSEYVRLVKTAVGVYELQVRGIASNTTLHVTAKMLSGSGSGITWVTGALATGSDTGDIYMPDVALDQRDYFARVEVGATTTSTSAATGALIVSGGVGVGENLNVGGSLTIGGNLTINGSTITVNATTMTVDDPILTLGGDTAPTVDDNKDRGVEFRYHNGTAARIGFFGFDDSTGNFTFIPEASNTSEVFSGAVGDASFRALTLSATTGTAPLVISSTTKVDNLYAERADTLANARTIAVSGFATGTATSFNGSANIAIPLTQIKPMFARPTNFSDFTQPDGLGVTDTGSDGLNDWPTLCAVLSVHVGAARAFQLRAPKTSSELYFRSSTSGGGAWDVERRLWHDGNDGANSGLDADLLDGQQGTYYRDLTNATGNLSPARLNAGANANAATFWRGDGAWATPTYTETDTLATVTGRGASTDTAIALTNTTASTSSTSGALTVAGGVGIAGNLHVGGILTAANSGRSINTFTGTGTQTVFTLPSSVAVADLLVNVGGILLQPTTHYTVSGSTLVFTTPPGNGTPIWVMILGLTAGSSGGGGGGGSGVGPDGTGYTQAAANETITGSWTFTQPIKGTTTSSYFADVAERYAADAHYEPGTVLVFGGEHEVTACHTAVDHRVAGVVSDRPAHLMNADAGPDETHPCVGLVGRLHCKIVGPVRKGDLLVTSAVPGHAMAGDPAANLAHRVVGKALVDKYDENTGVIEIALAR